MADDETIDIDDDEKQLSDNPEAKRSRERRRKGTHVRRGSRRTPSSSEIRSRLAESLESLAQAFEQRDPDLARILHRDGPKQAELLGKWADHPKCPPPVKIGIVVLAEVLEPLRAFGATVRHVLHRLRESRAQRERTWLDDEQRQQNGEPWSEPAEPEPEPMQLARDRGTPERFRADGGA